MSDQRLFAKDAQYVLVYKNPNNLSFSIIDELKSIIKNCHYSKDFIFKVRSFRDRRVIDKY